MYRYRLCHPGGPGCKTNKNFKKTGYDFDKNSQAQIQLTVQVRRRTYHTDTHTNMHPCIHVYFQRKEYLSRSRSREIERERARDAYGHLHF